MRCRAPNYQTTVVFHYKFITDRAVRCTLYRFLIVFFQRFRCDAPLFVLFEFWIDFFATLQKRNSYNKVLKF